MKLIFILLASLCIAHCTSAQTTWYVDAARPDNSGAGTSWATAEKEVQAAIDEAASGDRVWVKAGTYKPSNTGDRSASFILKNGVAVYGGFAGNETQLFQRSDIYNITILSGDLLGNDIGFTNNGDNSNRVVRCSGVGNTTILDGFTVTRGNCTEYGGAIESRNSSLVLNNIVFTTNFAQLGGGAASFFLGSATVNNCVFDNNRTSGAGAIDLYVLTSAKFTNCVFYNNTAGFGGLYAIDQCNGVSFTNCSIAKNHFTNAPNVQGNSNLGSYTYSDVSIKNSIIRAPDNSTDINYIEFVTRSNFSVYYNLIDGGWASLTNSGTNPALVDENDGDGPDNIWRTPDDGLRISCSSVAINASDPAVNNTKDITGITRTGIADIGAYESGSQNNATLPMAVVNSESQLAQNATGITHYSTCTGLVASVNSAGAYTIAGSVSAKLWLETTQPADFVKRHYEITPAQNSETVTGFVTLYFTQQEFNDFNAVNGTVLPTGPADAAGISNLRIEKRPGTSADGTGLPGAYINAAETINPADAAIIWNSTASRWEVGFEVTGFGGLFVKTNLTVLPLRLLSFSGSRQSGFNQLNWNTANELNTNSFELERSIDGASFTKMQTVEARGNVQNDYRYNDVNAGKAVTFYRLKMLDNDGTFTYSSIIKLSGDNALVFSVSPNPVSNVVNINISSPSAEMLQINLVDALGQKILTQNSHVLAGANIISIEMSAVSKGVYFLKMAMAGKVWSEKLVKD